MLVSEHRGRTGLHDPRGERPIDSTKLAAEAAWLADQKKGVEIRVLDVREQIRIADYFVLVTATSKPHAKALFNEIHAGLKALGENHAPPEGLELGWWVLADFGDVVVHVMQPDAREYYDLDHLYAESVELDWKALRQDPVVGVDHNQAAETA